MTSILENQKEKKRKTIMTLVYTHTSVIVNQKANLNLIVDEDKCR